MPVKETALSLPVIAAHESQIAVRGRGEYELPEDDDGSFRQWRESEVGIEWRSPYIAAARTRAGSDIPRLVGKRLNVRGPMTVLATVRQPTEALFLATLRRSNPAHCVGFKPTVCLASSINRDGNA